MKTGSAQVIETKFILEVTIIRRHWLDSHKGKVLEELKCQKVVHDLRLHHQCLAETTVHYKQPLMAGNGGYRPLITANCLGIYLWTNICREALNGVLRLLYWMALVLKPYLLALWNMFCHYCWSYRPEDVESDFEVFSTFAPQNPCQVNKNLLVLLSVQSFPDLFFFLRTKH